MTPMVQIRKHTDRDRDMTILRVSGRITAREIIDAMEDYYQGELTTNLVWDYTSSDVSAITSAQLHEISSVAKRYGPLRKDGKTAIVAPDDLAYGLGRMYEILNEINEIPVQYMIFKNLDDALSWFET